MTAPEQERQSVGEDSTDQHQSAVQTAAELRDELEAIVKSDFPFAYDAKQILEALDQTNLEEELNS
jgi:hypothetical protein